MNASAGHGYTFQRRWTACMLHIYLVSTRTSCVPDCGSSSVLILNPGAYRYAAAMSRDSAATRVSLIEGSRKQGSYPGVVYGFSEREHTPFPFHQTPRHDGATFSALTLVDMVTIRNDWWIVR